MLNSLTKYEYKGMNGNVNFADGHAYHNLPNEYDEITCNLEDIWLLSNQLNVVEAENKFKVSFGYLINSSDVINTANFKICPTSSNSIDIIAAYLKQESKKVLLIEPTFDNLYLLLARRGCQVESLLEDDLIEVLKRNALSELLDKHDFNSIFLVNPNNPTGTLLSECNMAKICSYCAEKDKQIIIDTTFRIYSKSVINYDYRLLNDSNISYIVIEDTGKTWPTNDMKASMLVYSDDCKYLIELIYEEIYLCHSRFVLAFFSKIFDLTLRIGIRLGIHATIEERIFQLQDAIKNIPLICKTDRTMTVIPIEWIDCSATGNNDIQNQEYILSFGLHTLPGRYFYWSKDKNDFSTSMIRMSLGRSQNDFDKGLEIIRTLYK